MSTLWTPSGEHEPEQGSAGEPPATAAPGAPGTESPPDADPELVEELRRLREQLAATPVIDIIANHAVGLWQLAIVHLAPEDESPPNLAEAQLAIDAMALLVEGLGERLGPHGEALRDALAQLRIVYVQVAEGRAAGAEGE